MWARLELLIPVRPRRFRYPGRRRADDRAALEGILYVVRTGVGWTRLPTALFGASGATCWRRPTECTRPGSGRSCTDACSPSCAQGVEAHRRMLDRVTRLQ